MKQKQSIQQWYQELYGCLADMGAGSYNEEHAAKLYKEGYEPANAAGELMCDEEDNDAS